MFKKLFAILLLIIATYYSLTYFYPKGDYIENPSNSDFSNRKAWTHVANLSKYEHFAGSEKHQNTINYIKKTLEGYGLEVSLQEGYTSSSWGSFVKAKNIVARIKGTESTSKALMLLSHYDSAPHSSFGASDAGSGVATILEGVRAFIDSKKQHKNDIIVLISDAEELGLNGARLFVNQHPWAKDVGLVLNFEARGSGGPSFMLMEVNDGGNNIVLEEFVKANPDFPVANSLAYSIYKELPNDTDLTVFREDAGIQGYNFAYIDDHFDYHTAMDKTNRLDNWSLSHQASYLMPLLEYFSNSDLSNLNGSSDFVYFNSPFGIHTFPFSWVLYLSIGSIIIFLFLLVKGYTQHGLSFKRVGQGFAIFFIVLILNGLIGFLGWKTILKLYPHYSEILQGFTYNGHYYIGFFAFLSIAICFLGYKKVYQKQNTKELFVAPLFFWILINLVIAIYLKGAGFFLIPLYFALGLFYTLLQSEQPRLIIITILCFPLLFIMAQFVPQFPIALGLKIMVVATVLVTILFGLLLPVLGFIRRKRSLAYVSIFISLVFLIMGHTRSTFTPERPRPNSLLYLHDADTNNDFWLSYDNALDDWNEEFFKQKPTENIAGKISFGSKYGTAFKHVGMAPDLELRSPIINISRDTIIDEIRTIQLCVAQQRSSNTIFVKSDKKEYFRTLKANNVAIDLRSNQKAKIVNKKDNRILDYWIVDEEPLEIECSFHKDSIPTIEFIEAAYNLSNEKRFAIPKRPNHMIPKPFVINDATLIKKTVKF